MKKIVLLGTIAASLLGSCTSESNILELEQQPSKIAFAPSLDNLHITRASQTFTADLQSFKVNAYLLQDGKVSKYMDEAYVSRQADNTWTTSTAYIWPSSGDMTFYSYSLGANATDERHLVEILQPTAEEYAEGKTPVINYKECSTDPKYQFDLLYATSNEACTVAQTKAVGVNFKHALSQIMFKVRNTNPNWKVTVSDIQIVNVKSAGKFACPTKTTVIGEASEGTWTAEAPLRRYITSIARKTDITPASGDISWDNALFLIPQTTTAWNPKDTETAATGSYFLISCRITTTDGILLWPTNSEDVRNVAIPVAINWEKGRRYTYTFEFGEGAGYIPPMETGEGEEAMPSEKGGEATLGKIRFDVSVDDEFSATDKSESLKM